MRKKLRRLALCSFAVSLAIYIFTYFLYHYLSPLGSFTAVYQTEAAKPMVTFLFGLWGVMFQFAAVMSLMIGRIFFGSDDKQNTDIKKVLS